MYYFLCKILVIIYISIIFKEYFKKALIQLLKKVRKFIKSELLHVYLYFIFVFFLENMTFKK